MSDYSLTCTLSGRTFYSVHLADAGALLATRQTRRWGPPVEQQLSIEVWSAEDAVPLKVRPLGVCCAGDALEDVLKPGGGWAQQRQMLRSG